MKKTTDGRRKFEETESLLSELKVVSDRMCYLCDRLCGPLWEWGQPSRELLDELDETIEEYDRLLELKNKGSSRPG